MLQLLKETLNQPTTSKAIRPILNTAQKSTPPLKAVTQNDLSLTPNVETFERFGICGKCEVSTRRGMVSLKDLKEDDEVLTRDQGWVSTISVLPYSSIQHTGEKPQAKFVEQGSLGAGLPQNNLAFGAKNVLTRYAVPPHKQRPEPISVSLSGEKESLKLQDCQVEDLCLLVLPEHLEILIGGVYVNCPAHSDLRQ